MLNKDFIYLQLLKTPINIGKYKGEILRDVFNSQEGRKYLKFLINKKELKRNGLVQVLKRIFNEGLL